MKRLTRRRYSLALAATAAVTAAALLLALETGPSGVGIGDAFRSRDAAEILLRLRGPRVLLAAVVGAALASSGVAFQALLRNPLADPFILGVSGGAAVGAVSAMAIGTALAQAATPLFAFLGALGATTLVYALSRGRSGMASERLLLTGVVVNASLSALILFLSHLAPPGRRILILRWMTGNLGAIEVGGRDLLLLGGAAFLALGALVSRARDLDLLSLGDRTAAGLGVDLRSTRALVFFAGSLATGAAVAYGGLVGFVGLIVPHALRLVLGPDHRLLLPASFLAGAAFLALADGAARTLLPPEEIPVGVLTALTGGPFFLFLLVSRRGGLRVGRDGS